MALQSHFGAAHGCLTVVGQLSVLLRHAAADAESGGMNLLTSRTCISVAATVALGVTAVADAKPSDPRPDSRHDHAPQQPSQKGCDYSPTKAFAQWNDNKNYVLTVNGGLEDGDAGWTRGGGAAVAEGNETFALGGAADHQSLSLPAGSSATTPANCVSRHTGIFRAFARTTGGANARLLEQALCAR